MGRHLRESVEVVAKRRGAPAPRHSALPRYSVHPPGPKLTNEKDAINHSICGFGKPQSRHAARGKQPLKPEIQADPADTERGTAKEHNCGGHQGSIRCRRKV